MELNEALDRSLTTGKEEEARKMCEAVIMCADAAKDYRWFPKLQKTGVFAREMLALLRERNKARMLKML